MHANLMDGIVAISALALSFLPAVFFARRAGKGTAEFFASGRAAPWWLIGTSMVATTFSTDTPNLVTDFVRSSGVSQNWAWWAFLITGMTTVFFYARLWRRSGVLTDLEFYELRYSGKSAGAVRGFRAIYLGLFFNCVIMATVTLAATKIANVMLGWGRLQTVIVCTLVCIPFASLSGLWGVMAADMVQFCIAMFGVLAAAYYALQHPQVGGLDGLVDKIDPGTLSLLPDFGNGEMLMTILIIPLTIQWWAVWYPGAEPGGGSYVAQRMLAAKDERHALGGTLWFNIAHYALRPWPWLIVALSSILVFPTLQDIQTALPHVEPGLLGNDLAFPAMLTLLPHGVLGILLASLFSAYVSTMSTHLNWGCSYVVNDFYKRFIRPDAEEKHLVFLSRVLTGVLMLVAAGISFGLDTASTAFTLLLSIGAGTGLIYLLRWFWWRINAWSEIAAMISSFVITVGLYFLRRGGLEMSDTAALLLSVGLTTIVWMATTFLTPAVDRETLGRFYKKVRPAGPGWNAVRAEVGGEPSPDSMTDSIVGSLAGCFTVYGALFGVGYLLYGQLTGAIVCLVLVAASGYVLWRVLTKVLATEPLVEG